MYIWRIDKPLGHVPITPAIPTTLRQIILEYLGPTCNTCVDLAVARSYAAEFNGKFSPNMHDIVYWHAVATLAQGNTRMPDIVANIMTYMS